MWWPVEVYEQHYLESDDPRRQSGFGGDEARWEAARRPIVRAIDRRGTFLDVGCANGYLLESLVRWSPHALEPYGLDFSCRLVDVARARLPQWADRFHVGDALEWEPLRPSTSSAPSSSTPPRNGGMSSWSGCSRGPWRPAGD